MYDAPSSAVHLVNITMPPLAPQEVARLFARRVHRPLRFEELERGGTPEIVRGLKVAVPLLVNHPVLIALKGNAGEACKMAARVTPSLASLWQLLPVSDVTMSDVG